MAIKNCKQIVRVNGCKGGVPAYRDDVYNIKTGLVESVGVVVASTVNTAPFVEFPCVSTPCIDCVTELEKENCICYDDIVVEGGAISGGWVNQFSTCDQCLSGDICGSWKLCPEVGTRSYSYIGLSDDCDASAAQSDIPFSFYSLYLGNVATPYWLIYIYENGVSRSWFVYDRQTVPKCRTFEIRRIGAVIEYYIDGSLVYTSTDTTNGACLSFDDSWHGTLNTGDVAWGDRKLCNIV